MLTSRQRVLNALTYAGCDRLPTFYQATPEFDAELKQHLDIVATAGDLTPDDALDAVLGVDMKEVAPRYIGPELRRFPDGSWEGVFGERYNNIPYEMGTYPEAVYLPYAGIDDVAELDTLRFPSAEWHDYSTLAEQCERWPDHAIVFGGAGIPDFMNGIARCRGVEQVLLDVGNRDPVYLKLIEKRHEYFLGYCEAGLRAAGGRIDILALGEDYGSQRGLLISPRAFDRLFRPYMQQYFDLAHKYGARAMMHSCGSVRELIPRFVDMGLDILDVVQVDAAGMSIQELHREFHGKIVLRGTMSVQSTLPFGSLDDVRREVAVRQELYAEGGLIIGPTHAIQPLTPVENVVEMYRSIGSLNAAQS
jgi:uroporphyrinogen decarboxylase